MTLDEANRILARAFEAGAFDDLLTDDDPVLYRLLLRSSETASLVSDILGVEVRALELRLLDESLVLVRSPDLVRRLHLARGT